MFLCGADHSGDAGVAIAILILMILTFPAADFSHSDAASTGVFGGKSNLSTGPKVIIDIQKTSIVVPFFGRSDTYSSNAGYARGLRA